MLSRSSTSIGTNLLWSNAFYFLEDQLYFFLFRGILQASSFLLEDVLGVNVVGALAAVSEGKLGVSSSANT